MTTPRTYTSIRSGDRDDPAWTAYSARDVSKLLGLRPAQVSRYLEDEVAGSLDESGETRFSFQDLILLRAAEDLRAARVPSRRIRSALRQLRRQLPRDRPPSAVRISAYRGQVVVRDGSSVWNPESGQALFDFALGEPTGLQPSGEEDPATPAGPPAGSAGWYERGCEQESEVPQQAVAAYRRALELEPDHLDAHLNVGRLLHEAGDLVAAERHYRAALRIAPDDGIAAFNLGVALEDLGRSEEALAAYRQALQADPACADAYFNTAGILERRGDRAGALRLLKSYRDLVS